MKKSDIMKKFTAKVAELMARGMWIHGETMRGSQGEICKVDLTDGQRLVRVLLADDRTDFYDTVVLIVGEAANDRWKRDSFATVWNDSLIELNRHVFYKVPRGRDWYVDSFQEAERMYKIHKDRVKARRLDNESWNGALKILIPGAAKVALPFVRRQRGCKGTKLHQIEAVYKTVRGADVVYVVETVNKQLVFAKKEA